MNGSPGGQLTEFGKLLKRIDCTRQGSWVRRFHTKTLIGEQNLGHHSFGVASLVLLLHPEPTITLIKAALWHDMAEQEIGDVPSPALRADPTYGEAYHELERHWLSARLNTHLDQLAPEEQDWLWALDKLECLLFSKEQYYLGNRAFFYTLQVLYRWFREAGNEIPLIVRNVVFELERRPIDFSLSEVVEFNTEL